MKQKVGFLGLGLMGSAMAANILKSGYPLTVYNRTAAKAEPLAKMGAAVAATPKALAEAAEVTIAMVTGPEALYDLLFGEEGAAEAFEPGKVFINMSSVAPGFTREMAVQVAATGAAFVDAPVSGTRQPAQDGALVILAGGKEDRIKELEPLLLAMGKKVIYCGRVGQGSMMKMVINHLLGVMMEGFAEALNFGRLGGLDFDAMLETVAAGAMNAPMFQVKAPLLKEKKYPAAFPLKHMTKDLKFVVDTAYEIGAPVPAAQILLHLYRTAWVQGWGNEDVSAIARVLEHLSGK